MQDEKEILQQVPKRLWHVGATAQRIAASLEQPARNVAALISEWRAVLHARAPGFPMKRPNTNHALAAARRAGSQRLASGAVLTPEERAAAHAAVQAADDEVRRVDGNFARAIHVAVTVRPRRAVRCNMMQITHRRL